jgi:hypothetical protein
VGMDRVRWLFGSLFCALLTSLSIGCRSTAPSVDSSVTSGVDGVSTSSDQIGEPVAVAKNPVGRNPKYSDLLLWEKLSAQAENTLTRVGVARCKLDHAYVSCVVQGGDNLETLLDAAVSSGLRHKIIGKRKDIEFETRVLADISCDKTDATLPPYASAAAQCRFDRVRAFNEAVIDGDLAIELLSLTRGDGPLADQKEDSTGVVSCQIVTRKINVNCSLRRVSRAGISDDARVLSRSESVDLSEKMIETLQEIRTYSGNSPNLVIPSELAGSARCTADDTAIEAAGRRGVQCVIRM